MIFLQSSPLSILVNNNNEIFKTPSIVTKVFECNHEKANTRMIFTGLQQKTNAVVCSKGTNVFVLLVFSYALNKINEK